MILSPSMRSYKQFLISPKESLSIKTWKNDGFVLELTYFMILDNIGTIAVAVAFASLSKVAALVLYSIPTCVWRVWLDSEVNSVIMWKIPSITISTLRALSELNSSFLRKLEAPSFSMRSITKSEILKSQIFVRAPTLDVGHFKTNISIF